MLVIEQFPEYLDKPFLPFFDFLYSLGEIPGYGFLLKAVFYGAGLLLLFNRWPRIWAICLGILVLLANVQAEINFRNHSTICGFVLLLAGLQPAGQQPWLIRWQMVVVYLGAWLNKQLDPDWLDGSFFEFWTHERLQHSAYMYMASLLPAGWLSLLFSWVTIMSEFVVLIGLCIRKWWTPVLWIGLLFHLATFVFMKGNPFGHFLQSLGIAYLAFLTWPESSRVVHFSSGRWGIFFKFLQILDFDHVYLWRKNPDVSFLQVEMQQKDVTGMQALSEVLFYSSGFYWMILFVFSVCMHLLPWPAKLFASLVFILVILFPFSWSILEQTFHRGFRKRKMN